MTKIVPKCSCGGSLKQAKVDVFDFTDYVSLPVLLQEVSVLRCTKCGEETLDGRMIDAVMDLLAAELISPANEARLAPQAARYLRRYLGYTQTELADKMGIRRGAVAKWETDMNPISPQHDFILRTLVLTRLRQKHPTMTTTILPDAVEQEPPAARRSPVVIDQVNKRLREQAHHAN